MPVTLYIYIEGNHGSVKLGEFYLNETAKTTTNHVRIVVYYAGDEIIGEELSATALFMDDKILLRMDTPTMNLHYSPANRL